MAERGEVRIEALPSVSWRNRLRPSASIPCRAAHAARHAAAARTAGANTAGVGVDAAGARHDLARQGLLAGHLGNLRQLLLGLRGVRALGPLHGDLPEVILSAGEM